MGGNVLNSNEHFLKEEGNGPTSFYTALLVQCLPLSSKSYISRVSMLRSPLPPATLLPLICPSNLPRSICSMRPTQKTRQKRAETTATQAVWCVCPSLTSVCPVSRCWLAQTLPRTTGAKSQHNLFVTTTKIK